MMSVFTGVSDTHSDTVYANIWDSTLTKKPTTMNVLAVTQLWENCFFNNTSAVFQYQCLKSMGHVHLGPLLAKTLWSVFYPPART